MAGRSHVLSVNRQQSNTPTSPTSEESRKFAAAWGGAIVAFVTLLGLPISEIRSAEARADKSFTDLKTELKTELKASEARAEKSFTELKASETRAFTDLKASETRAFTDLKDEIRSIETKIDRHLEANKELIGESKVLNNLVGRKFWSWWR